MASIKMQLTTDEFNTILRALSKTERSFKADAIMWNRLADDPELPRAKRNAEVCTEEAEAAGALYAELIAIQARQDAR